MSVRDGENWGEYLQRKEKEYGDALHTQRFVLTSSTKVKCMPRVLEKGLKAESWSRFLRTLPERSGSIKELGPE